MRAKPGDRIILAGELVDQPTRAGEVLEARGADGGPPYVVKWEDGHTSTMFPGPGAVLRVTDPAAVHQPPQPRRSRDRAHRRRDRRGTSPAQAGRPPGRGCRARHRGGHRRARRHRPRPLTAHRPGLGGPEAAGHLAGGRPVTSGQTAEPLHHRGRGGLGRVDAVVVLIGEELHGRRVPRLAQRPAELRAEGGRHDVVRLPVQ